MNRARTDTAFLPHDERCFAREGAKGHYVHRGCEVFREGGLPGARVPTKVEKGSAVGIFVPRTDGFERLVLLGSDDHDCLLRLSVRRALSSDSQ